LSIYTVLRCVAVCTSIYKSICSPYSLTPSNYIKLHVLGGLKLLAD